MQAFGSRKPPSARARAKRYAKLCAAAAVIGVVAYYAAGAGGFFGGGDRDGGDDDAGEEWLPSAVSSSTSARFDSTAANAAADADADAAYDQGSHSNAAGHVPLPETPPMETPPIEASTTSASAAEEDLPPIDPIADSNAMKTIRCVLYTGPHTTALARWTPILKDFARRISPPTPRFQSPPSAPFNSN